MAKALILSNLNPNSNPNSNPISNILGVVAASLFSDIGLEDTDTMDGFLFFAALFNALAYFDIIPTVFSQREVYYKQADSKFFPAFAFAISQTLVFYPMHIAETLVFGTMSYWAAGLSGNLNLKFHLNSNPNLNPDFNYNLNPNPNPNPDWSIRGYQRIKILDLPFDLYGLCYQYRPG
jgi:hypothetical protein